MNDTWRSFLESRGAVFENGRARSFGVPAAELAATRDATVLAELSDQSLLRARGTDAQTFLNGQFSNDIRRVDAMHSQLAAWCDAKGRALALLRVFRRPGMDKCREGQESESGRRDDDYYLQLPVVQVETVLPRLRIFILRAKVAMDCADAELANFGLSGPHAEALLRELLGDVPQANDDVFTHGGSTAVRLRGPHPRFAIAAPVGIACDWWDRLRTRARPVTSSCWTWLDIAAGLPQIYPETSALFVPQMLNLELLGGVDFKKGCYPGQEIVARMQYLGRLKQRMYRVRSSASALPGMPVYAPDFPGQAAGTIVSAAAAPGGDSEMLAVLQISSAARGELHLASEHGPPLEMLPLPYAVETR